MYWQTSQNSKVSMENKVKIYKTIIKPICTYGIPLWGTAAMNQINKPEIIRTVVNAPWYIRNQDTCKYLKIPTIKEEMGRYLKIYKEKMATRPNQLAAEACKSLIV